jgi:hypothetical protein
VDEIQEPMFVYAGANDPRVPRSEGDLIVETLRKRKVPIEYMVAENEGHSLARRENLIASSRARRVSSSSPSLESRCGRHRAHVAPAPAFYPAIL